MKKLQCAKCGQVYWTELSMDESLVASGEWIKNICPKCNAEWAVVEPLKSKGLLRKVSGFDPAQIKSLREKLGLSQRDLAILIKVTPWAIISWEKGRSKPRKDKINKLIELAKKNREEVQKMLSGKISIS
ncbi:MAG: helix-turn-helix domain-containing protein [Thermodesulfobacteriota bacterium]